MDIATYGGAYPILFRPNGTERLRITSGGDVVIGSFTPVDTRNTGGIHIQPNKGISFRAYANFAASRNWRIRNDDTAFGNLDFSVGDNNSTDIGSGAADAVLSLTKDHYVGINQSSPTADLEVCPIDAAADTATIFINAKNHDASVASEAILKLGYNQSHANDSIGYVKLIEAGGNSYDGHLTFGVPYNNSGTPATREALRITSDGQLNLGSRTAIAAADSTTSPTHFRISRSDNAGAPLITMGAHEYAHSTSAPGAVISSNHRDFIITKFHPDFTGNSPGLWLKGNEILMYSGSSETLRLTSNGSVLVNTTSGHGKFQVHDGTIVHSKPSGGGTRNYRFVNNNTAAGDYGIQISSTSGGSTYVNHTELKAGGDVHIHDGNLVVASGHGIDFSSTGNGSGSMTNELLDDYEEGTWTPTAHSGGSGISNISATYTRVGRIVHVQFRGYITGINGSLAQIGGLPYANWQSYAHQVGPVMHNGFDFAGSTEPTVTSYITGTNSYFQLYYSRTNSGGWVHATGNDTGGDQFITSLTYFVA